MKTTQPMQANVKSRKRTPLFLSLLLLFASTAFGITSKPSEITYVDGTGNQRIYSFARGNNGHLVVYWWNGSAWQWADQGLPASASAIYAPSAITYLSGGQQRIYAFAEASNGHLVVNWWNSSAWQWADQGLPAGASAVYTPFAITYLSGGQQRIYVFAQSSSGHLVVNYWNGSTWQWADQGLPAGAISVYRPAAITYLSGSQQRIYVFAESSGGHLVVNYWNGSTWQWADQGLPAAASAVSTPAAITYLSGGLQRIYVFGQSRSGHLVVNWWNGSTWQWADQGLPAGASAIYTPAAITYLSGSQQRIYAFAESNTAHLVVNWWNGSAWQWADQGSR
jgi:hypothetical protein